MKRVLGAQSLHHRLTKHTSALHLRPLACNSLQLVGTLINNAPIPQQVVHLAVDL